MTNATQTTVHVHRVYINAPAQKVWDAITDPKWNGQYAFHAPSEYDLRPGGAVRRAFDNRDAAVRRAGPADRR